MMTFTEDFLWTRHSGKEEVKKADMRPGFNGGTLGGHSMPSSVPSAVAEAARGFPGAQEGRVSGPRGGPRCPRRDAGWTEGRKRGKVSASVGGKSGEALRAPVSRTPNKAATSPSLPSPDLQAPLCALPGSLLSLHEVKEVATGGGDSTLSSSVIPQAGTSHLATNREIKSQGKT